MLELRDVSFKVEADTKEIGILEHVSFTLEDNQFVAITGPNGGGKSTLAKIIAGILKPTEGKIFLDGQDITETVVADMTTADFTWTCFIEDTEFTDNTFVTWKAGTTANSKKIKLGSDYNYIGKTITIKCTVNGVTASKDLEITD